MTEVPTGGTVWLDPIWRGWETDGSSHQPVDQRLGARQYDHWGFAERLTLQARGDDVARGTMMQKLWNAVDGRVRLLFELYGIGTLARNLGWTGRGRLTKLQVLTRLGLVRPLALNQLQKIRNLIEHQDREPPTHEDALQLVELVWYFLRSTDSYVCSILTYVDLVPPRAVDSPSQFVSVTYDLGTWAPLVRGRLPATAFATKDETDLLALDTSLPLSRDGAIVTVNATINPTGPAFEALVRSYFRHDLIDTD